jgi:PAS domain S-box-containing protein
MDKAQKSSREDLPGKIEQLESRLREAEETLHAVRSGEVDALFIATPEGDRVFMLRGAEKPYRIMIEHMSEGALNLGFDGTILYCNPRFAAMVKTPIENVIGNSIYPFVKPEEKTLVEAFVRRASSSDKMEISLRDADGMLIPVLLSLSDFGNQPPVSVCIMATDMTNRKRAEALTVKMAREWQETFDATNDAIWILDKHQRVVRSNKTAEQLFHRPLGEMIGRHGWEIVHGTAGPIPGCPIPLARESQHRETMELQVGERWFQVSIDPIFDAVGQYSNTVHIVSDITERKLVEEALQESELRYRLLVENVSEAIVVVQDGKSKFVNRGIDWAGYTPEEYKSIPVMETIHPEDREVVEERYLKKINGDKTPTKQTYRGLDKSGRIHWVEISSVLIDWEGRPATLNMISDITERNLAEEKLKASLLEKETLLKEIHHRVKNNLQVISSLLRLQSSYLQDEKAIKALEESVERVETMSSIHTQLYQSQDLTRVDFGVFIQELLGNIRQSYGRVKSPVEIHVNAGKVQLDIDNSIPCGLILNELISNALKHAFPEGKAGEEITIGMRLEDNQVVLTVQDNGIGFPASIDVTKAKTLGLDMVNILVRQMHGKIDMLVDGGTTWTITFTLKNEREWRNA